MILASKRMVYLSLLALTLVLASGGCRVGYVLRSGKQQLNLLRAPEPVSDVLAREDLPDKTRRGLEIVADVKSFGEEIGLKPTKAYQSIALDWDGQMWNISACDPLAFKAHTWWFPVVGRVPYLGFFRTDQADRERKKLEAKGLDVYQRKIGTYSSLGWFADPLLPEMLDDSQFGIAKLILHELAHATVWVPGSVSFNESFASFVGDEAAERYMVARFGPGNQHLKKARKKQKDTVLWRKVQHELTDRLVAVYRDKSLTDAAKLEQKTAIFLDFPNAVAAAPFHHPAGYVAAASKGTWNNARLIQFRAYNENRPGFDALLAYHDGDLLAFMEDVKAITNRRKDPWVAIREAAERPRPAGAVAPAPVETAPQSPNEPEEPAGSAEP